MQLVTNANKHARNTWLKSWVDCLTLSYHSVKWQPINWSQNLSSSIVIRWTHTIYREK